MTPEFDNTYVRLPDHFFSRVEPEPVPDPQTLRVNAELARQLGFDPDWLGSEAGARFAVGNELLEGSEPIAMAYAGHQFGGWVPQLGDGRALLLGEVVGQDGERWDIQLKGSGRTPYSRRGDGRAPLGPVLREYLVSEAMDALGIPTTRSLVAAATGAPVRRETALPGGVLVRVAESHVRIGTFEYFAGQRDEAGLQVLTRYVIERHYPALDADAPDAWLQLLAAYAGRLASLVAQWQLVGFIHGVMNTDNMLLSGETIDYGPCAFMNDYDPETVYSSIDRFGRYAYGNQPRIAQWNLSKLAEALLRSGEMTEERIAAAQEVVDEFPETFRAEYGRGMGRKLGLDEIDDPAWDLIEDLLELMYETNSDYTLTFRRLANTISEDVEELGALDDRFEEWVTRWHNLLGGDASPGSGLGSRLRLQNPAVIPRNHLVDRALEDAVAEGDLTPFHDLVDVVKRPWDVPEDLKYTRPPRPDEEIAATFCGT